MRSVRLKLCSRLGHQFIPIPLRLAPALIYLAVSRLKGEHTALVNYGLYVRTPPAILTNHLAFK